MYKFNSTYGSIRALIINSEPYFVSSDISSILGYTTNAKALKLISEDSKKTYSKSELLPYDKGPEPLPTYSTFINTTGLWTLLTLNVTPQANYLSSWIKSTVIPQLKSPTENLVQTPEIFTNPDFGSVRVVTIDNEPWFVGKDVAEILGYTNSRDAVARHVEIEDKTSVVIPDSGSNYKSKTTLINESGLYSLILSSKLPSAKKFKHWVTAEVLPSIRRHGIYATENTIEKILSDPDYGIRLLTELKEERSARKAAEALVTKQKEEIDYQANVIKGLTNELPVPEIRALINRIIRRSFPYAQRWSLLYKEVKYMHHIDLKKRFDNYNELNPDNKYSYILDYADNELHMIPQIFETCMKIYASDAEDIVNYYYKMRGVA